MPSTAIPFGGRRLGVFPRPPHAFGKKPAPLFSLCVPDGVLRFSYALTATASLGSVRLTARPRVSVTACCWAWGAWRTGPLGSRLSALRSDGGRPTVTASHHARGGRRHRSRGARATCRAARGCARERGDWTVASDKNRQVAAVRVRGSDLLLLASVRARPCVVRFLSHMRFIFFCKINIIILCI